MSLPSTDGGSTGHGVTLVTVTLPGHIVLVGSEVKSMRAGFATSASLRSVIARARAAGKRVVVHLPQGGGTRETYAAMSADRVRWEHIQRIYEMCNRNVSETARRLNMHRRTLQRILAKRAPR